MFQSRTLKISLIIIVILAVAGAASALAAANTVPDTYAGDGSGTISGYTVTNIEYNLNATDPGDIDSVEFDLNAAATAVTVQLVDPAGNWFTCSNVGNHWTCTTTGATVLAANQFRVIAGDIVP